jgi:RNA polymerase sigma-70 factor (ECF subfamily)
VPAAFHSDPFEARLIARFKAGDGRALDTLFDRYADRALGLAVRLTETREDAEEVASDAFVRAFRHARTFHGESGEAFGPWLLKIVRNVAADKRGQLRLPTLSLDAPGGENVADARLLPGEEAAKRSERADLLDALESLPEEWKTVLTLCDLEDMPHKDAALVLGRSAAATKSLLYRARRALRDRLAELWKEDEP